MRVALAILACLAAGMALADGMPPGETPGAILIELDRVGRPLVRELPSGRPPLSAASRGLCIWNEQGQDRWQSLGSAKPASANREAGVPISALADASRAGGEASEPGLGVAMLTAQLDPLVEPEITRATGLLTPPAGPLLDGRITLRRLPQADGPKYPKITLLLQSGETTARIAFEQGQSRMTFHEIAPQLPPAWKEGLPPGQYTLQAEGGLEGVTFSVEEEALRRQVTRHLEQLRQARIFPDDPLYVQIAVEQFMNHRDRRNRDRHLGQRLGAAQLYVAAIGMAAGKHLRAGAKRPAELGFLEPGVAVVGDPEAGLHHLARDGDRVLELRLQQQRGRPVELPEELGRRAAGFRLPEGVE